MSMRPSQIQPSSPSSYGFAPSYCSPYRSSYQKTCNSHENMLRFLARNVGISAALPKREDYSTEHPRFCKHWKTRQ